jgi:general secretion pathway protein N
MSRVLLLALFVCVFFVTLVASFPLALALQWSGLDPALLSARSVSGSIWNGRLSEVRIRRLALGDVAARVDPFALAAGTLKLALSSERGSLTLLNGRRRGIEDADMTLSLQQAGIRLPLDGAVRLERVTMLFDGDSCTTASGRVSLDLFQRHWGGPVLTGNVACMEDAAVAALGGGTEAARVRMIFAFDAQKRYRVQSQVASSAPLLRAALAVAGFRDDGANLLRVDEGVLQW